MMTFMIDLAYTTATPNDSSSIDELIEAFLGTRTSSGLGFGLRDMQWSNIPQHEKTNYHKICRELTEILPPSRLAYITMASEAPNPITKTFEVVVAFQAPWYESEGRTRTRPRNRRT